MGARAIELSSSIPAARNDGARATANQLGQEKLMKAGFIGIGRMGQAMARRLLDGGQDVGIYNRTAEKLKPLIERGAKALESISAAAHYGEAVFTMLADDAAVMDVATKSGGLVQSLRKGGIHICAGTHSVACIAALKALHEKAGQI